MKNYYSSLIKYIFPIFIYYSGMLSSPRKICKLFIKFTSWNKCSKAEHLITQYPECIMPWQKAFEEAVQNKSYSACNWLYTKAKDNNITIDIHFQNDKFILELCKYGYLDNITMIIQWDKEYQWLAKLASILETLHNKERIVDIIKQNTILE